MTEHQVLKSRDRNGWQIAYRLRPVQRRTEAFLPAVLQPRSTLVPLPARRRPLATDFGCR